MSGSHRFRLPLTSRAGGSVVLLALCLLLPSSAYAYTLQCSNGFPVSGGVFLVGNCAAFGITNIFSGLNCSFQVILNEVISRMYCGIQFGLKDTLNVCILLYVIIYAIGFTTGIAQLTAKELVTRLIKIALIWAFAMNASWGVGMAFYFFAGGIETVIGWVLSVLTGNMDAHGFFLYLDQLLYQQLTGGLSTEGYALLGFFTTLFALMPPVFLLFAVYLITVLAALTRALVSYLLGLSAIAFLLSVGPIFVSMALFKSTYTFFDSWLKYMISFAMQIILIFAALALWLFVMSMIPNFFLELARHIVPYERIHSNAAFAFFKNTWGYCAGYKNAAGTDCISGEPWPPSAYANDAEFIFYLSVNLLALGIIVYAFDALLRAIPGLARDLSGPKFAPQLGGGAGFGAVQMPGFSAIGGLKRQLTSQAYSGFFKAQEGIRDKIAETLTQEGDRSIGFYKTPLGRKLAHRNRMKSPSKTARDNASALANPRKK